MSSPARRVAGYRSRTRILRALPVAAGIAFASIAGASLARGQVPQLALDVASVIPGQNAVPLGLRLSHTAAVESVEVGLELSASTVDIAEVVLAGGVLDGLTLEFAAVGIDADGQEASLRWVLDSTAPFSPVIPAGSGQLLATVLLDVAPGISQGTTVLVDFVDGAGTPPTQNRVKSGGAILVPTTVRGELQVSSADLITFRSTDSFGGETDHLVEVMASNASNVQGFSTVVAFDPALLQCSSVGVEDTITEAVGAEFVEDIIENSAGYAILGVLLDIIPPYQAQVIPVTGLDLPIARYRFDISDQVEGEHFTPIRFVDGLGTPAIENIFVVGNQSILPEKTDYFLRVLGLVDFLRGDATRNNLLDLADVVVNFLYVTGTLSTCPTCPLITCPSALDTNDDGDVDLADGIYLGSYLYNYGPPPPPPFPIAGPDPTPDGLTCD